MKTRSTKVVPIKVPLKPSYAPNMARIYYLLKNPKRISTINPYISLIRENMLGGSQATSNSLCYLKARTLNLATRTSNRIQDASQKSLTAI